MEEQITGRLEHWYIEIVGNKMILWGCLYDDVRKRWEDGRYLHTSVTELQDLNEGDIVHTANSVYLLGEEAAITEIKQSGLTKEALEQHYHDVEDESRELREWLDSILSVD